MLRSSASVSAASVAACQSSEPIGIVSVAEPPCAAEVGGEDCRTVEAVSPVPVQMWQGRAQSRRRCVSGSFRMFREVSEFGAREPPALGSAFRLQLG